MTHVDDQHRPEAAPRAAVVGIASRGVWLAPEDAHLALERSFVMSLDRTTSVGYHRPSADVLLTSLGRVARRDAIGVVLTGVGRDGAKGVAAIHAAGGLVVAQDPESAIVDGMPSAAGHAGAELSLPCPTIGTLLSGLTRARSLS